MEAVKSQKSVLDVMSEWSRLLTQFHDDTEEVYSLLASPFILGTAFSELENTAELICEKLESENLIHFTGRNKVTYFKMGYCPTSDIRYTEIRYLVETLQQAAGYYGVYRGCLILELTDWIYHEKEKYFDVLLSYLSDKKEEGIFTLFYVDIGKEKGVDALIQYVSKYFRLDVIDLREMDDKIYLSYAKQLLTEKNILSEEDTEQELLDYISLLRKRASFNGFDTIRLMCDEIEVQYYLQEGCTKKPLSGGFIRAFSDNDFSKRYLSEKSQSRQIGFSVRVQE